MIPDEFWQPWAEIDPSGTHGGIPGELADYVGARLGDNPKTKNIDLDLVFQVVRDTAASLSMHPYANKEGPPERGMVEETLKGINWILERMLDRTRTVATKFFTWCHATPPYRSFFQRPIRYPLRSTYMDQVIYHLLGDLVEIAENNANAFHSCMDPSSAQKVMDPVLHLKGNIIRDWFDQEVANDLFADISKPGPTIVPRGETQPAPEGSAVGEVLRGVSLLQWYPGSEHWAIFARKQTEQYKPERIWQPEGAGSATEDIAPETPMRSPAVTPG
jgi:hypothetical protein